MTLLVKENHRAREVGQPMMRDLLSFAGNLRLNANRAVLIPELCWRTNVGQRVARYVSRHLVALPKIVQVGLDILKWIAPQVGNTAMGNDPGAGGAENESFFRRAFHLDLVTAASIKGNQVGKIGTIPEPMKEFDADRLQTQPPAIATCRRIREYRRTPRG